MTNSTGDDATLDDVIDPSRDVGHPDRREHAKTPKHLDETELDERTREERATIDRDRNST